MSVMQAKQPSPSPVLAAIHRRRSVSPRRLAHPGPTAEDVVRLAEAALAAPDHGLLRPWRLLVPDPERLADLFERALLSRVPEATGEHRRHERQTALNAPAQLILIARIDTAHPIIPVHEQWIAIGAALQNILLAAEALGYGAKILSGERAADPELRTGLALSSDEVVVGFVAIGTTAERPPARAAVDPGTALAAWPPTTAERVMQGGQGTMCANSGNRRPRSQHLG
jgi:nitroreductase